MNLDILPLSFRKNFQAPESTDSCWLWEAGKIGSGYGATRLQGYYLAHRYSFAMIAHPIPPRLTLDHLCRNRACVNPWHLEPIPLRENILRGVGSAAINARRTSCVHGHPFNAENTQIAKRGGRVCLTCRRALDSRRTTKAQRAAKCLG